MRPSDNSQSPSALFKCSICTNSFVRQEHLTRHIRIHTREKPFQCGECGKCFSRQDVLNRHLNSHEETAQRPPTRAALRACKQCAVNRVRCSREQPCRRCSERRISCVYPPVKNHGLSSTYPMNSADESGSTADLATPTFPTRVFEDDAVNDGDIPVLESTDPSTQQGHLDNEINEGIDSTGGMTWMDSLEPNQYQLSMSATYDWGQMQGFSAVNWMSPEGRPPIDWDTLNAELTGNRSALAGPNSMFPFNFSTCRTDQQDTTPWTVLTVDAASSQRQGRQTYAPVISDPAYQPTPKSQCDNSTAQSSSPGRYYVDGAGSRAPFGGLTMVQQMRPDDSFSRQDHNVHLLSTPVYTKMVEALQSTLPNHATDIDTKNFPPYQEVEHFIEQYFRNFHPIFPILRKSCFEKDCSEDWILLLAVATIGSRYMRHLQGIQTSTFLISLLSTVLDHKRDGILPDEIDIPVEQSCTKAKSRIIQANILCIMCMMHGGNKSKLQQISNSRYHLIDICSRFGYLSPKPTNSDIWRSSKVQEDFAEKWLEVETEIRIGLMIWFIDSLFEYEFGLEPLIQLERVRCPLPSPENLWESVDVAKILDNQRVTMPQALEALYMEKKVPPNFAEFSVTLLINAIYRKTRDVALREQTGLNSWVPTAGSQGGPGSTSMEESWPPLVPIVSKWRNSACDCLDVLHWLANSRAARHTGFEHHNILYLHLSRFIILAPTKHIATLATSSTQRQGSSFNESSYATARDKVLQWAIRDHFKARLTIIHCGALFWHVRRYSCNSIMEPFAVYIATLVLWAYCVSQQFARQEVTNTREAQNSDQSPVATAITNVEEQLEPSFLHLDRPIDDELVQAFVQHGDKLAGYMMNVGDIRSVGAPRKILEEGIRLLRKDRRVVSNGSEESSPDGADTRIYTWGIEESYVKSLRQLVAATMGQS